MPGVKETFAAAGGGALEEVNKGEVMVALVPTGDRTYTQEQLKVHLRAVLRASPAAVVAVQDYNPMAGGGNRAQLVQFNLRSQRLPRSARRGGEDARAHAEEPRAGGRGHHLAHRQAAARGPAGPRARRLARHPRRLPRPERPSAHGRRQGRRLSPGRPHLRHQGPPAGRRARRSRRRSGPSRCGRYPGSSSSSARSPRSSPPSARRRSSTRRRCARSRCSRTSRTTRSARPRPT